MIDWHRAIGRLRIYHSPGALPALDGLRGIAILLVVGFHAAWVVLPEQSVLPVLGVDLLSPLRHGWMGVNLFFVLSGFLITHHLIRAWPAYPTRTQVWHYLAKRWLRIVPTYYFVLFAVGSGLVPYKPAAEAEAGFRFAYHLVFLQDYLPSDIVAPFWSLGVEEKFYLLLPLVFLLLLRLRSLNARVLLLIGIAALPLVIRLAMYRQSGPVPFGDFILYWRNPFHLNLDALFLGSAAAAMAHQRTVIGWPARPVAANALVVAGGILVLTLMFWSDRANNQAFVNQVTLQPAVAVAFSVLILGVALRPPSPHKLLDHPLLGAAGRLAFPWYLTHTVVLWWLVPVVRLLPAPIALGACGLASVAVALLIHWLVERPCLLLKEHIGRARLPTRAEPA